MIIPKSQGTISSQPQLQQHTPMTGLSSIGNAIGGAIEGRDKKQQEEEVSAKRLELYHNDMAEKEAKLKLDDVLTTEMSEQVTMIKNDLSNGAINAQAGNERFKKWSDDRYKQIENDLPEHARTDLKDYWNTNINQQTTGFLPLQLRADTQKDMQLIDRAFDIATRYDDQKGSEYLDGFLATANIPEAEKSATRQKYNSTRNMMSIDGRINNAVEGKSTEDLNTLLTDLRGGVFGYLDGPTLQQKEKEVLSRISAIDQHNQVLENKRVTLAGKQLNDFKNNVLTSALLDSDYRNSIRDAVKGTEFEGEFDFFDKLSDRFQDFGRKSSPEMLKLINQQEAQMKNHPSADPTQEEKILSAFKSMYQDKLSKGKENPNQLVREAGIDVHTIDPMEIKTNPKTAVQKIVDNAVSQQALKDANVSLKPISAEDLPEAKKAWDGMDVNGKLNFIGESIQQTKGIKSGEKIWKATLQQLGGADRTYYLAGLAKAKSKKINNEDLASALINGKYLVDKGGFILPTDLESTFRARYGNLSNYGAYADDLTQFKYAYAVIANRDGVQHAKKDDIPNVTAMNKAFELATGGVYSQETDLWFGSFKTSGGGSFKTWKVPKPYGLSDERFEANLEAGYINLSKMSGHTVSELKGFRLAPRIDRNSNLIMYDLLNERGQPLRSKDGKKSQFIIFNGVTR